MGPQCACRRTSLRRACRGTVTVCTPSGGPAFMASLADIGAGGARLTVERPLAVGEIVRVVFPGKLDSKRRQGRMIIGRVVHASPGSRGRVVGIEFGSNAVAPQHPRTHHQRSAGRSIFSLFPRLRKLGAPRAVKNARATQDPSADHV
jgi:hypothetical protein